MLNLLLFFFHVFTEFSFRLTKFNFSSVKLNFRNV